MKKLTKFEMASGHRAAPCECERRGEPCNERGPSCVLFFCSVCRGAESDLTSECCGRPITEEESKAITDGKLDYKRGEWYTP